MEAIRNGVKGVFSDTDWATGQPQRYGWQEVGKEKKELPKEIIQFIQRRRPPEIVNPEVRTVQNEMDELSKPDFAKGGIVTGGEAVLEGGETVIPSPPTKVRELEEKIMKRKFAEAGKKAKEKKLEKIEIETSLGETITVQGSKVTKHKTKSNDNPKQKDGGTAKRKPGRMAKN